MLELLLLMASPANHQDGNSCISIDMRDLHERVEAAVTATTFESEVEALASLREYWERQCVSARFHAKREIVMELGRVLKLPLARPNAAAMLVEIGPNLPAIGHVVTTALADQRRIDRELAEVDYPRRGQRGTVEALLCLQQKIKTGRLNSDHCWALPHYQPLDSNDIPEDNKIVIKFHNNFGNDVCLGQGEWPSKSGFIVDAAEDTYIEIEGIKYFPKKISEYCPKCRIAVGQGETISGYFDYSQFGIGDELRNKNKALNFRPVSYTCRISSRNSMPN